MGYNGTTAASSISNPPVLLGRGAGGTILGSTLSGLGVWIYQTSDASTLMVSSVYFTDAWLLGMRQNDIVMGAAGATLGSTTYGVYQGVLGPVTTAGAGFPSTAAYVSSTR